ncbi:Wzz/FepE/Etk N-terminal domain-containing protein [Metabacillus fastidiosus]|uniref:YveK family protein n=1 Tax=Metabacillus fastidiosus TaxID=1458 RepID=UPI002E1AE9E6|nr:Wzz/FepE/Etk N-terminal domain-containing protein [Metabacillus fastidiosus]MED4534446.1 Wzz/FepE/Etk N-terminal domain-containing protein [Metabacillus fastidiosus]
MEETISLKELFQTLKKHFLLIILITVLAIVSSGIISYFFVTPIYQSSTQILVNQTKDDRQFYDYSEVQTNLQLINTYKAIIVSKVILEKVIEKENLNMSVSSLKRTIAVSNEQESQVVNITVQNENPKQAAIIANTVASVFKENIPEIMNVNNVSILAEAEIGENPSPIKPKPTLNMAIALVIGLMAGVGISFLIEYLDNTVKTEQDIELQLEMPVLGTIATIDISKEMKIDANFTLDNNGGKSIGS